MICRIWRGWTTRDDASAYEKVVTEDVIPGIEARKMDGFLRIELMRRDNGDEVEFATIMWFDSADAIRNFIGDDYETAHVPPAAQKVLKRYDERSVHYDILDQREQS